MGAIFEFIVGVILFLFYGVLIIGPIVAFVSARIERKKEEKSDRTCRQASESSDDFMQERKDVIRIVGERLAYFGSMGKGEYTFNAQELKQSSDIASLFRYAHFAGCHITFEADICEWKDDPEYLNPDVFKTDIGEAADMRDQRYMQKYKRYYDPPRSQRDRKLIENGIIFYEQGRHGCHYRVVHREENN